MEDSDKKWWQKAVIYELYIDKFAGNIQGLIGKLDYLQDLGINTLWLLPHYPSPLIDGGYDISDYKNIRSGLGDLNDFDDLVVKAHQKGLKVVLDMVLNHTSDQHPWFLESASSKNNAKRNWYIWADNDQKYSRAFVHFSDIKKSNWIYNERTGDYYYATFYPQQPDLNWDNPEVYNAMLDAMNFWLDRGVDGFRLDAIARLIKRDDTNCFALPETHEVIKKIRKDLEMNYPECVLIAESGGWINEAKTFFGNGDECQVVINFPLAANILASIEGYDEDFFKPIVDESTWVPDGCKWGIFLTNHDTVDLFFITNESKKNRLAATNGLLNKYGMPGSSSFAARLAEVCSGEKEKILWSFEQLFRINGVPIIYYGNEIGMRNIYLDPKPNDAREYVRANFKWDDAQKQLNDKGSLLNCIRRIINHKV